MLAMAQPVFSAPIYSAPSLGNASVSQQQQPTDMELTSLAWLQKPGVLNSMCTALTGSPQRVSWAGGTRAARKPKTSEKTNSEALRRHGGGKQPDKMMNVILNVRNRKYNGEDTQKPPLSFACMIFMAVESSPQKMLPVKEIYEWIMWKFPFYRNAHSGWKNSVRHNLSLNKCFRKVERSSLNSRGKSPVTKGGLWMVDGDYRRSLLAALRRSPFHPYHSYFTPPLSPSDSNQGALWCNEVERVGGALDQAEKEAAISMCMISGNPDSYLPVTPGILHAIHHDHSYAQRPQPTTPKGLSLAEVAAAAELILQKDWEVENMIEGQESDEGFGGEEYDDEDDDDEDEDESEAEENMSTDHPANQSLADSGFGYGSNASPQPLSYESRCASMEELGVNALLCLAGGTAANTTTAITGSSVTNEVTEFAEETTVHTMEVVPAC